MAGPSKQPFRGKQRLDSKQLPRRPKARKPHSHAPDGEKRSNIRPGGLWGIIGLVGSFAALWLYASGQQGKQRRRKADTDSEVLAGLRSRPLIVTGHGACRMDCRHIPGLEVQEVLRSGSINSKKSKPHMRPCPKYVVDARVGSTRKNVQCVFSACRDATHVVTVIDKDTDWRGCLCP